MRTLHYAKLLFPVLLVTLGAMASTSPNEECTTAIISSGASVDGSPLLWKNRDTGQLSNKVVYVEDKPYNYLAIVNADNTSGRSAWGGLNSAGFAIMNSVSYNLPQNPGGEHEQEGKVMADALRTCATVDDFEAFIRKNMGPGIGVRSNFGVIDALGGAASFEVSNKGYKRYDAKDSTGEYILKTNSSVSGTPDQGAGYVRFDRETTLFKAVPSGKFSDEFVLEVPARDLGSPLLQNPTPQDWKTFPADKPHWVQAEFTIDRMHTASSFIIHGVRKGEDPRNSTLWVILGEPVCSIAVPLWVAAGETPAEMRDGKDAPIEREAARLRGILRPLTGPDRGEFVDVTKLDNQSGTGWLPGNLKVEDEIFQATRKFLAGEPSSAEMAAFETEMAAKALSRLQEDH